MFKILSECTATMRKSLEGLDYYLAEGVRAFKVSCTYICSVLNIFFYRQKRGIRVVGFFCCGSLLKPTGDN